MITSSPPDTTDSPAVTPAHEQEARLLMQLLRSSRLSLLFGESGSDKTAFLHNDLLPLLQRRAGDRPAGSAAARESGVVVPFPDRRKRGKAARRRLEWVVTFDDWSGAPWAALQQRIAQVVPGASTLAAGAPTNRWVDDLNALGERLDANFIIVLDRFEAYLRLPPQREGIAEFADELVAAINEPRLAASFLIALDEDARPWLAPLRSRIPGFDDFSLKLPGTQAGKTTTAAVSVPSAAPELTPTQPAATQPTPPTEPPRRRSRSKPAPRPQLPPRVAPPTQTRDVYAFIEATLARTATASEAIVEPFHATPAAAESESDGNPRHSVTIRPTVHRRSAVVSPQVGTGESASAFTEPAMHPADQPSSAPERSRWHAAVEWVTRLLRGPRKLG